MKQLLIGIFCFCSIISYTQFKADNVKYKTVFPEDLCKTLQANAGYTILDVRSDAEFYDTAATMQSMNIGHLNNAIHINVTQLPARWKELIVYKDKPLFIYCSHSQRSRRASRLLADSGFTDVFNINGGLTNFYAQGIESNPCSNYSIVTSVPYKIISPKQFANSKIAYYIIDLRSDSVFTGKTMNESEKNEGRFENAVNIPFVKFKTTNIAFPDKPILLVDESGDESGLAAKLLNEKGFKNVSVLFNGMSEWVSYAVNTSDKSAVHWIRNMDYKILSANELNNIMKEKKKFALIDVRPKDQFNNQSKNYWQNLGQVKTAVNIPYADLNNNSSLPSKSNPVIIYGFNNEDEAFNAAKWFKSQGYKNVSVLEGGIWRLRWAAHNIKNKMYLNDLVVNVPPQNE